MSAGRETPGLAALAWPAARLGELLEATARAGGLPPRRRELPPPAPSAAGAGLGEWIERAAGLLGLEAEPADADYRDIAGVLARAGPAVVRWPGPEPRFLGLVGAGRRGRVRLLGPDRRPVEIAADALAAALAAPLEAPLEATVDGLLERTGVPPRRRRRARRALLAGTLGRVAVEGVWQLRPPPSAPLPGLLVASRVLHRQGAALAAHLAGFGLFLAAWATLGRAVVAGRLETGWLIAWALLLLTAMPLRAAGTWWQGQAAVGFAALLERRLLAGALRLPLDEVSRRGHGQLLGEVIESEGFESSLTAGAQQALLGGVEVALLVPVAAAGAGGGLHAAALVACAAVAAGLGWRYRRELEAWTAARLDLTGELVERMAGYRTRLAQQAPGRWHRGEDASLEGYLALSRPLDRTGALLHAALPRGWMIAGTAALVPAFVGGEAGFAALAVAFGVNLVARGSFARLAAAAQALAAAAVSWRRVAPLFRAAREEGLAGEPAAVLAPAPAARPATLEVRDLAFRYLEGARPVLDGLRLSVAGGERVLLVGRSGAGKSTLVSLVAGLRDPDAGLILLDGLDRASLGDGRWRRRAAAAPQFHDNHVLMGSLAFNLLLGRTWPPAPEDLAEAEAVCRAVGLGELLDRMPAGLEQTVGETGWQLSHGERSRVFLARALLQGAGLVVLDESFAALDPDNARRALDTVLERAPTLLVVAHP